jgi:hypothetical protein
MVSGRACWSCCWAGGVYSFLGFDGKFDKAFLGDLLLGFWDTLSAFLFEWERWSMDWVG